MKKWAIQFALKQLFSGKNSEGPSLVVGLLMTLLAKFAPAEILTPEFQAGLLQIATVLFTYTGARFYKKMADGEEG